MRRSLAVLLALAAGLVAGCGGSSRPTATSQIAVPATVSSAATATATATPVSFPSAGGKVLSELKTGVPEGLELAPSVSVLQPGRNRYGFALFDAARKQLAEAPVALYVSNGDGTGLRGPYVAHSESLAVRPQFESRTTQVDPDAAKSVYVAELPFARTGRFRVTAIAELDGRAVTTTSVPAQVSDPSPGLPPAVGARAPLLHTPTLASVGGDAARIDTRSPAATDLLTTDLATVYGRKPVALLFATPALCQSRVCGPVVDVMEEVRNEVGDRQIAFIHNEIYRENRIDQGLRPQPAAYRLPTEPWLFVLDRRGRVAERIEGAFSAAELERAVAKVTERG
ncbi:MAG TPA: hypothetical protein VMT10_02110 [Solirubrobacteraceae bacterium]|nr:hypothetical protein [Solirubrobacteraceae bacterium]